MRVELFERVGVAGSALCLAIAGSVGMLAVLPRTARAETTTREFLIRLHVIDTSDHFAATEHWAAAQLYRANELFEPSGVRFALHSTERLPVFVDGAIASAVRTAVSRASDLEGIDAFVVPRIDQHHCVAGIAREPGRTPGVAGFIVVSPAVYPVVAHELGHYFGLEHSTDEQNLMRPQFSLDDDGADVVISDGQAASVESRAAQLQGPTSGR